ncbi:type III sulfide quinone reductase, selenoprotein subtype [Kaistella yonginensis]|uniref:type III sulfide quinone reductase, selenoprotein subtype n=1 Tax=Kaistella yonginensis TaxID=658267 RepID=UPI0025B3E92E|nr:FAD/NAD(P)-binding oxidoreductase [Kaistella yonginensis]MDN3607871.1 FAD/NAD(P)-binding oxidoreductase [Kaistella yonginensis]
MKNIVILGSGTAGTMMANHLTKKLQKNQWQITLVDQYSSHYYQPGFLFIPFGTYKPEDVKRTVEEFLPKSVHLIKEKIDKIDKDTDTVLLSNGKTVSYDLLIIATGCKTAPEEVIGMKDDFWYKTIFDFYTFEGSCALAKKLETWEGGKMVVHITEMPIKCPVAPLEFAFLADDYFTKKGMRDKVEISYVTPLSGAFTKEKCTKALEYLLEEKNIKIVPDFAVERIEGENGKMYEYGGESVDFDLLVTVPTNMGDECILRSGFGDDLNYVPTDKHTLQSKVKDNIFVIGDATNVPASKAGSVAHFQAEILTENIMNYMEGKPLKPDFDGHANCFIETGKGKALLIDFNYETEPLKGKFPFAVVGPLNLLEESTFNHFGKMAFKWVYWNMLLPARKLPFITPKMSTAGKIFDKEKV